MLKTGATSTDGVCRGSSRHLGHQVPLFGGCGRRGSEPAIVEFIPAWVHSQRAGHHLLGLQGQSQAAVAAHPVTRSRCELLLLPHSHELLLPSQTSVVIRSRCHQPPSQMPGAVMSCCCLPHRLQECGKPLLPLPLWL